MYLETPLFKCFTTTTTKTDAPIENDLRKCVGDARRFRRVLRDAMRQVGGVSWIGFQLLLIRLIYKYNI